MINVIRYPALAHLLIKHNIKFDADMYVDDGWFNIDVKLAIKLPDSIAQLFD